MFESICFVFQQQHGAVYLERTKSLFFDILFCFGAKFLFNQIESFSFVYFLSPHSCSLIYLRKSPCPDSITVLYTT